jgi:very-short-patch-repair endonuclease
LLTPAERSFFGVLDQAVSSDFRIFAKVRLADLVRPAASGNRSEWQRAFNRISSKHVDFVLCDLRSLSVLGVVEIDDQSHKDAGRRGRDAFVDEALGAAGIPVVRFEAKRSYHAASLRQAVQALVSGNVSERNRRQPVSDFVRSNTPAGV